MPKLDVDWDAVAKVAAERNENVAADCDKRVAELRAVLRLARCKLEFYRVQHSGEYVGGVEYTELIRAIDRALRE